MKYKSGDLLSSADGRLYIINYVPEMMDVGTRFAKGDGYWCVELFEIGYDEYTIQIILISASWINQQGFKIDNDKVSFKRDCVIQAFEGKAIRGDL